MKKILKKNLLATLLITSLLSVNPSPSYSAIAVFASVPALAWMGIITIAVGGSVFKMGQIHRGKKWMWIGALMLDERTQAHPVFGKMTGEIATGLGFDVMKDHGRINAYNESLTKINLLLEQIIYEAQQDPTLNPLKPDSPQVQEFVNERWMELAKETLSDDAYSALRQIQTGQAPEDGAQGAQ